MSDLLIKNMEMPKSCEECPVSQLVNGNLYAFCHLSMRGAKIGYKLTDCPLVEVKEHGRLMDVDAEIAKIKAFMKVLNKETESGRRQYYECDCVLHYLTDAPAIMEASE